MGHVPRVRFIWSVFLALCSAIYSVQKKDVPTSGIEHQLTVIQSDEFGLPRPITRVDHQPAASGQPELGAVSTIQPEPSAHAISR